MRRAPAVASVIVALALATAVGRASPDAKDDTPRVSAHTTGGADSPSRSLGWPWRGRLYRGERLQATGHWRFAEGDIDDGNFWGTAELVGLVRRSVRRVSRLMPGSTLTVGELSERYGGNIVGHRSHENGRDADLGFYLLDEAGEPVQAPHFVHMGWGGRGRLADDTVVRFDDRRNWLLVESMLRDSQTHVQHVFVWGGIRKRLLEEAKRQSVSETLYERAQRVIMSPNTRHPHRNHFHVRVYCPRDDIPGCRDRGPFWEWLPEEHPFSGLKPGDPLPW